ncbi:MAG: patatin family protein [Erysipelotrichaceae bacterium]|nr:patatin family protein [Erysipelotrichaceae bacterium]
MERIGLVLEGGGVRGAYTAGCLSWLYDNGIHFDYSAGISSGAVYLSCFLMGKPGIAKNMSTQYACDPNMTGFGAMRHCGHYVDYEMIFTKYLRGVERMSTQPLIDANPDMEVGAYDLDRGETVWFTPKDMDPDLVLLRATCALPVAAETVEYNGRKLLDGGITKMIPIERAVEKGCTKVFVITTKPADFVRKPASKFIRFLMKRMYKEYPQVEKDYQVRHINYYKQMKLINDMVAENKAILMYPTETVKVSRFKGDREKCLQLYNLGYADMEKRKDEIFAFMKKEDQ